MTCKDCIGYKFCSRGREGRTNFYGKEVACNNVEELCNDFKNKADFVEVVRCKDCDIPHNKWTGCPKLNGLIPPPDFFCGYGERSDT